MLLAIQKNLDDLPLKKQIQFEVADIESLPYSSNTFDCVLAHMMIYHASSLEKALSEVIRVLKNKKWVGITTVSSNTLQELSILGNQVDPRISKELGMRAFTEDVAEKQLQPFFHSIQKYVYETKLKITDSTAIAEAVATLPDVQALNVHPNFLEQCRIKAEEQIQTNGSFNSYFRLSLYVCTKS